MLNCYKNEIKNVVLVVNINFFVHWSTLGTLVFAKLFVSLLPSSSPSKQQGEKITEHFFTSICSHLLHRNV